MGEPRYEMTVSRNGQVSIPAAVRARWQVEKVVVTDLGTRVVIEPRPEPSDPDRDAAVRALYGKYRRRPGTPSLADQRRREREQEADRERRRFGR